jgi:hypothetical protein
MGISNELLIKLGILFTDKIFEQMLDEQPREILKYIGSDYFMKKITDCNFPFKKNIFQK